MLRRHILQGLMAAPWVWSLNHLAHAVTSPAARRRVVVVGSGAFGGWAALNLARGGADVTLIEAWAAGHPRSSSGGETRVIRHMYANPLYARMVARSLALFARAERDWRETLLHRSGVLFLGQAAAAEYFEAGTAALREHQIGSNTWIAKQSPHAGRRSRPTGSNRPRSSPNQAICWQDGVVMRSFRRSSAPAVVSYGVGRRRDRCIPNASSRCGLKMGKRSPATTSCSPAAPGCPDCFPICSSRS